MADLASRIGFGCVGLTGQPTRAAALRLLEEAHASGISYFDTAPGYGRGYSERLLGEFLRRHRNERIAVATKFGAGTPSWGRLPSWLAVPLNFQKKRLRGHPPHVSAAPGAAPLLQPRRISRNDVRAGMDASRRALGVERIDCYLLHEGLPAFLEPDALGLLFDWKREGVIGSLGVAANGGNYLALEETSLSGWDILQYEFGPAWPQHRPIPERFPRMRHCFHSVFRDHGTVRLPGVAQEDVPARILRDCLSVNAHARVLFSSGKPGHIRDNMKRLLASQAPLE